MKLRVLIFAVIKISANKKFIHLPNGRKPRRHPPCTSPKSFVGLFNSANSLKQ